MSEENVETLRRCNAAFNRRDRDGAFAGYASDVEWRDLQHSPDSPERMQGIGAVAAVWDAWENAFDEFEADIEEYVDIGDRVRAVTHWRATGKESGVALDQRTVDVYEFAEGRILRATVGYADKAEALRAVGLAE